MSYSGWKNWQTWNVALWAGNNESVYRDISYIVSKFGGRTISAKRAKEIILFHYPDGTPDMDGTPRRYRGVDWSAISKAFNEF
jgi:hypothetical protein